MTTENEPLHQSLGDDKVMTAGSSDRVWEKKRFFGFMHTGFCKIRRQFERIYSVSTSFTCKINFPLFCFLHAEVLVMNFYS